MACLLSTVYPKHPVLGFFLVNSWSLKPSELAYQDYLDSKGVKPGVLESMCNDRTSFMQESLMYRSSNFLSSRTIFQFSFQ